MGSSGGEPHSTHLERAARPNCPEPGADCCIGSGLFPPLAPPNPGLSPGSWTPPPFPSGVPSTGTIAAVGVSDKLARRPPTLDADRCSSPLPAWPSHPLSDGAPSGLARSARGAETELPPSGGRDPDRCMSSGGALPPGEKAPPGGPERETERDLLAAFAGGGPLGGAGDSTFGVAGAESTRSWTSPESCGERVGVERRSQSAFE